MRSTRAAALLGMVLAVAACGGSGSGSGAPGVDAAPAATTPAAATPDDAEPDTAEPDTAEPGVVVPAALQFSAPLVGGGQLEAAALAGRPTVFWFWAPT